MAPKTVQALIEDKFAALAEAAGLEFVTSGEYWLVMDTSDGLDTRLRIKRTFESAYLWVEMTGQAVERPDVNFFRERQLVRANAGASNRPRLAVTVRAAYDKGDQLAKVFSAARDMLAPFAASKPGDEDMPPLLLWVHGQDGPGVALTGEVRFAGEARLDALSTPVPAPAGLEPIRAALAAGVITEARVTDAGGTVIFDSREG